MSYINKQATIDAIYEKANEELADANHHFLAGVHMATAVVRDMPEQLWIPCSERLPEHGGRYLISVLDDINRRTTVAPYLPRCKAWTMTGRMAYWKVIAWMPLPEPYGEEDHETG